MTASTRTEADAGAAAAGATGGAHQTESFHGETKHYADIGVEEAWSANVKRTYDEHQTYDRETGTQHRSHANRALTQALDFDQQMRGLVLQRMQNGAETDNMIAKQAVRHSDMAIDRQWNPDEVAQLNAIVQAVLADLAKKASEANR